ncbi:DUF2278 family protein [Frankia sp. AgB32]|uniref:DUF2278 family protein n=1 Tax=Frankia sp. AgB32 TaxID=631119 RepID=UPI00200C2466|nr:DUF2278 family protein [Frankia sp. AgB32]MCK9896066.1 YukJ family protein [Frankia sp. AgB32]
MALQRYGVLKGRVLGHRREGGNNTPHYQLHIDGERHFRAAVNVLSDLPPSELLYVAVEDFDNPVLERLKTLDDGFTVLENKPGGLALDFIRGSLFDRRSLRSLPADKPGQDNDLADVLDHYVQRAEAEQDSRVYVFGERWPTEPHTPDKIFGFKPGNGVHDIHMNQGNAILTRFVKDDGVWQDGALLFHFPAADRWVAVFLAFQSQTWHTDDTSGHALPTVPPARPGGHPASEEPDQRLRIAAALINPAAAAPGRESVTVINTMAESVNLAGWKIADRDRHRLALPAEALAAGDAIRIQLSPPLALGNHGGTITLLDPAGLKVDGVAYTSADAAEEGITMVF